MRRIGSSTVSMGVLIVGGDNRRSMTSARNDCRVVFGDWVAGSCARERGRKAPVTISRERSAYARIITRPPVKNYVHQPAHHTSSSSPIEDRSPRSDEFIRPIEDRSPRSDEFIRPIEDRSQRSDEFIRHYPQCSDE